MRLFAPQTVDGEGLPEYPVPEQKLTNGPRSGPGDETCLVTIVSASLFLWLSSR